VVAAATAPTASTASAPPAPPTAPLPVPAASVDAKPTIGAAIQLGRLAVYPVIQPLASQRDPGPLMLLDDALAKGLAEVREVGTDALPQAPVPANEVVERRRARRITNELNLQTNQTNQTNDSPNRQRNSLDNQDMQQEVQQIGGQSADAVVNTLVIENKSDTPIFVLAGTVVKGGKQDRQIGQDFVVDARQTTPVDAFCVEQGRWNANRDGAATDGKFSAVAALATSKVRAAGQYEKNQQAVWDNVAVVNGAHEKSAGSGTLLATFDDPTIKAKLDELARKVIAELRARSNAQELIGLAWAVDGRVQGVRYFAHHRVYDLVSDKLASAVAVDLLTAEAAGPAQAGVATPGADEVFRFIDEVEVGDAELRKTSGANDNVYRESKRAWGSKTVLKAKAGKADLPLAYDFVSK
jgi:hypothetical protein